MDNNQKEVIRVNDNNFYCVIPWKVLTASDINELAKLMFGEIMSLCNVHGFCWATNKRFSVLFHKSISTISRTIIEMENRGYIKTEISKRDGNLRKIMPLIPLYAKTPIAMSKNDTPPIRKNAQTLDIHIPELQLDNIYTLFKEKICSGCILTDKAKDKIKTRAKVFKVEELKKAISNFSADSWWMENNAHRGIAWFFHSDERISSFINMVPRGKKEPVKSKQY